jgi:ComF family protein
MGEIWQLLFSDRCVGCALAKGILCDVCAQEWNRSIRNMIDGTPLISSALYSPSISQIVLRAKENNDSRARRVIANQIALHILQPSIIVPIPSSASNNRRRGFDHSFLLAKEVARLTDGIVWQALSVTRRIKDQAKLSHGERFTNLTGSYRLTTGNAFHPRIVLIDDLVTTGASMREAIRAMRSQKGSETRLIRAVSACIATHHLPNTISR